MLIGSQVAEFGIKTSFQGQDFYDGKLGVPNRSELPLTNLSAVSMVEGELIQRARSLSSVLMCSRLHDLHDHHPF
jgi:hypothetical protein